MPALRTILLAAAALVAVVPAAQAATIPVTTTADTLAADGLCSLREAVFAARFDSAVQGCPAGSGDDVVQLEAKEYRLAAGGSGEDGNNSGDLDTGPSSSLRIIGRGIGATTVGGAGDRIFDVAPGANLGLSDMTVRDGVAQPGGPGGAVRNRGTFTALRVSFVNNAAGDAPVPVDPNDISPAAGGGAIWSDGQLEVADSVFTGNRAGNGANSHATETVTFGPGPGASGGAILVEGGTASLSRIAVSGSRAGNGGSNVDVSKSAGGDGGGGGAIAVTGGAVTVTNGTFQANRAGDGGTPAFGKLSESDAGRGGALFAEAPGTLAVTFSTFSGNAAGTGPNGPGTGASIVGGTVGGSILADAGGACAVLAPASLANVVLPGDTSCPGTRVAGDPRLGTLADNGGPVPTMAPGAGSPAIDALVGVPCPATDARGLLRPVGPGCDAGALEVQPGAPGAPGGGGAAGTARSLTGLTIGPAAFRAAGRGTLGTTVSFRLGAAGTVVLSVRTTAPGRRAGKRCVAPTRRNRAARRCTRVITLPGRVAKAGAAGANTLRFTGKLRGRALRPGRYTLVLTLPTAGSAPAVSVTRAFRILPPRR